MDDPITTEPLRACPGCPGTGWVSGWKSAWQRSPRGPQAVDDVACPPVAPEPEPDAGLLMGGF